MDVLWCAPRRWLLIFPLPLLMKVRKLVHCARQLKAALHIFINSLHHKEHLQMRQTPQGPLSLTDTLVYYGTIWLTNLINLIK